MTELERTQFYLDMLARNSSVNKDVPLLIVTEASGRIVALAWPDYQAASESPVEFPSYATPELIKEIKTTVIIQRLLDGRNATISDQASEIEELKQQLTEANGTVDRLKIIIMSEEVKQLADQG